MIGAADELKLHLNSLNHLLMTLLASLTKTSLISCWLWLLELGLDFEKADSARY